MQQGKPKADKAPGDKGQGDKEKMKEVADGGAFAWKMYIVVNSDLDMRKGKLCAQVGHAVAAWTRRLEARPTEAYAQWVQNMEPKIVLKADQKTMDQLCAKYSDKLEVVTDAGKTQVPAGSMTVVAFPPLPLTDQPPEIKQLKLL